MVTRAHTGRTGVDAAGVQTAKRGHRFRHAPQRGASLNVPLTPLSFSATQRKTETSPHVLRGRWTRQCDHAGRGVQRACPMPRGQFPVSLPLGGVPERPGRLLVHGRVARLYAVGVFVSSRTRDLLATPWPTRPGRGGHGDEQGPPWCVRPRDPGGSHEAAGVTCVCFRASGLRLRLRGLAPHAPRLTMAQSEAGCPLGCSGHAGTCTPAAGRPNPGEGRPCTRESS